MKNTKNANNQEPEYVVNDEELKDFDKALKEGGYYVGTEAHKGEPDEPARKN